jgi:DNA-binding winged helix-turn-helix (wHTH) protein/tetratricopeptide (TPR) repeat protein
LLFLSTGACFIYRFETFALDPAKFELRKAGAPVHLEPQALALLLLLVGNADRLISKDELIEKVWSGRFISDSVVSTRIKEVRKALGDDGQQQRLIRTVHGKGYRFCGDVTLERLAERSSVEIAPPTVEQPARDDRPSIAVLPFRFVGEAGSLAFVAEGLADELISDLSRLHWLLVIARASTFRFRGQTVACQDVGSVFGVRYCLTGTLEQVGDGVTLSVELAGTRDGGVIWSERFAAGRNELHDLRREILAAVVSNLEVRIMQNEVQLARQMPPAALGAWSSYHLGLDHMFRFNKPDNRKAALLFEQALAIDPHFSRAMSGLSFTSFQDSFLQYSDDRIGMASKARELAELALRYDPLDPFAHLNLGRALWFEEAIPESIERLSQCIALSPNYAQGIYSKSWAAMTQCDDASSDQDAALALRLSPLDPLRYAMLAVRSVSAFLRGDYPAAAELGESAARSPGAHKLVVLIAALGTRAAGHKERAEQWLGRARELDPHVDSKMFLSSFPFTPSAGREAIEKALHDLRL